MPEEGVLTDKISRICLAMKNPALPDFRQRLELFSEISEVILL
jgi:hypothetical protein